MSSVRASFLVMAAALASACDGGSDQGMSLPDGMPTPDAPSPTPQAVRVGVVYANGARTVPTEVLGACLGTNLLSPPPAVACAEGVAACEAQDIVAFQKALDAGQLNVVASPFRASDKAEDFDVVIMSIPAAPPQSTTAWCHKGEMEGGGVVTGQFNVYVQNPPSRAGFVEPKLAIDFLPSGFASSVAYPAIRLQGLLRAFGRASGLPDGHVSGARLNLPGEGHVGIMSVNGNAPLLSVGEARHTAVIFRGYVNSVVPYGLESKDQEANELAQMRKFVGVKPTAP